MVLVDGSGRPVDGDDLLYVIASARQDDGQLSGGVMGTVMSNLGLELALKDRGIPFQRTRVGDRYIHQALVQEGWAIGGETSGHILCLDRTSTGDGIVSALQVLEIMSRTGRSLADLAAPVKKFPQIMINVPIDAARRGELERSPRIQAALAGVEAEMQERGRVILRPSGTEPLIRVTLEGDDAGMIDRLARVLAEVVREELST